jgi:hypothetical protein
VRQTIYKFGNRESNTEMLPLVERDVGAAVSAYDQIYNEK